VRTGAAVADHVNLNLSTGGYFQSLLSKNGLSAALWPSPFLLLESILSSSFWEASKSVFKKALVSEMGSDNGLCTQWEAIRS